MLWSKVGHPAFFLLLAALAVVAAALLWRLDRPIRALPPPDPRRNTAPAPDDARPARPRPCRVRPAPGRRPAHARRTLTPPWAPPPRLRRERRRAPGSAAGWGSGGQYATS